MYDKLIGIENYVHQKLHGFKARRFVMGKKFEFLAQKAFHFPIQKELVIFINNGF